MSAAGTRVLDPRLSRMCGAWQRSRMGDGDLLMFGDGVVGDGDGDGDGEESWLVEHLGGGRVVRRAGSRHIHLTISSRVELVALDGDPVADDVDRLGGEGGEREGSWPPGWCRSSRRRPDPG